MQVENSRVAKFKRYTGCKPVNERVDYTSPGVQRIRRSRSSVCPGTKDGNNCSSRISNFCVVSENVVLRECICLSLQNVNIPSRRISYRLKRKERNEKSNRGKKRKNRNLIKTTSQQICARYYCARDGISLSPFLAKIFFNNPDSQTRGPIIFKSLIRIPLYMYISRPADSFQPTAAIPRGNSHFVQQLIQFFRFVEPIGEPREIPPICPPRIIECHRDPNTLPVATSMRVQAYFSHTNQQHETI